MSNKKNFEMSMEELQKIIDILENGENGLDDSVHLYKKAVDLISSCEKKLKEAELEVEIYKTKNSCEINTGDICE